MSATTFKTAGGKELVLAPFVLATTRIVLPKIQEVAKGPGDLIAKCDLMVDILAEALRRANPEATKAWIEENVTSQELEVLFAAVLAASGLTKHEAAPGEAKGP